MDLQNIHETQKVYVKELAKALPFENLELWKFVRALWPQIKVLEQGETKGVFEVTMSPLMNTLAAVMCADHNADFHTGEGYLQTLPIVGICSAVTSQFSPGYVLKKISPDVSFNHAVKIGKPVTMSVELLHDRGKFRWLTLNGWLANGQDQFVKDRKLIMIKIEQNIAQQIA